VLGNLGGLDHTVAVDLEEVDDAAGEVGAGGEEAGAGELVGAAHQDLGEFDGARLVVEVEGLDTLVALELDEAVAVGVAADVEAVEGAVVDAGVREVEVLGVGGGGVEVDDVDAAVLEVGADEVGAVVVVIVGREEDAVGRDGAEDEADVFEVWFLVVVEEVVGEDVLVA